MVDNTKNAAVAARRKEIGLYVLLIILAFGFVTDNSKMLRPYLNAIIATSEDQQENPVIADITADDRDDDKDDDNNDGDRRPWLIMHVGPPKTATTTIQEGLASIAKNLAKDDNFYYMGSKIQSSKMKIIQVGDDDNNDNITMFRVWDMVVGGGTKHFSKALREHNQRGHNVILSAEHYATTVGTTFGNKNWGKLYDNTFLRQWRLKRKRKRNSSNNNSTGSTFANNGDDEPLFRFRVKIVVAYRHFFQWLPSFYYQNHLMLSAKYPPPEDSKYIPGIVEYIDQYLTGLVQYDPNNNRTNIYTTDDFNGYNKNSKKKVHGSLWAYLKFSSRPELYDRIDIFDLHQQQHHQQQQQSVNNNNNNTIKQQNLFPDFVCQSLPSASNTCRHLNERNKNPQKRSSHTTKFTSIQDKLRINQRARLIPELNSAALLYDLKGQKGVYKRIDDWFHTKNNHRRQAAESSASVDNDNDNDNDKQQNYSLKKCLSSESMLKLKVASWNFLLQLVLLARVHSSSRQKRGRAQYFSSLFQSSTPTNHLLLSHQYHVENDNNDNDESWIIPTKAAHDESFDEYISTGKFCELDIEKMFEDEEFVRFVFKNQ